MAIDESGLNGPELRAAMAAAGYQLSKNHCYKLIDGQVQDPRYSTIAALIVATGVPAAWFFDADIGGGASSTTLARYISREGTSSAGNPYGTRGERQQHDEDADGSER